MMKSQLASHLTLSLQKDYNSLIKCLYYYTIDISNKYNVKSEWYFSIDVNLTSTYKMKIASSI